MSWHIDHPPSADDPEFTSQYATLQGSIYPSAATATDGTYARTLPTPNSGATIRPLCVDPNVSGRIWAVGTAFGQVGFTDDDGTTFTATPGGSGGIQSMLITGNYAYLSTKSQVWRSPKPLADGTGLSWTKIWDTDSMALGPAGSATNAGTNAELRNSCVAVSGSNGYIVEYGSTTVTGGPSLYYSSNIDTATAASVVFTKPKTWANGKHCHAVQVIGGVPWVTIGDATFTDLGVWTATNAAAGTWNRRSLYGEANGGTTEYGINMLPMTIGGQSVVVMEYDGYGPSGPLIHPTQTSSTNRPTRRLCDLPNPYSGSMRGLTLTAAGHLMWVTTGESAAIGPLDSIWIAKAPFTNPILLESFASANTLGTIGDPVTNNGYVWFGNYRCKIPTLR